MDIRSSLSKNDMKAQLQAEVRALSAEERQDLKSAGITIDIPPDQGLAMKADLAIPWNKLRIIRRYTIIHNNKITNNIHVYDNRWLTTWNVQISSERSLRKRSKAVTSDNLKSEVAPLTFSLKSGREEIRGAPLVFIPSLNEKLFQLLDKRQK